MKPLPTLYSRTNTGAIQEWNIEVQGDQYRTIHGQTDGKKQTTEWTTAQPTNVGRSNERLGPAQAQYEAKATWKKKKEGGYWEDIADIDRQSFIDPLLAQNYDDRKDEIVYPVMAQPKLDGHRCITYIKEMQSRNGKQITSCPHVYNKLSKKGVFAKYPDLKLDGELYTDKLSNDFNKICSIIKKKKPTENELMEADATIQYWIYDVVDTVKSFKERNKFVQKFFEEFDLGESFVYVPTFIVHNEKELTELYEQWVEAGYEGQMVRSVDGLYEPGRRSPELLKRKEFQDREYEIKEVCEGNGNKSGMAGYMILINDDGSTFRSNIKGDRKYLRELLKIKDTLVGKQATVKFFNLTPDKVPRFPYVINIRDGIDAV